MTTKNLLRTIFRMANMAILVFSSSLTHAATISLVPSSTSVAIGDSFQIDVIASDTKLGAFDVVIGFAPALVSVDPAIAFFEFLGSPNSFQGIDVGLDTVTIAETSFVTDPEELANLQPASFRLARLSISAIESGTAVFTLNRNFLSDPSANDVSAELSGTAVTITGQNSPPGVPEPSAAVLIGSGMLILVRRMLKAD